MSRGRNYWEVTFDPAGKDPVAEKKLTELDNFSGFENSRVVIEQPSDRKRLNLKDKRFAGCDFRGGVEKASFTKCEFENCKFEGVHLSLIKFSQCTFKKCHFFHVDLKGCIFIDCVYEGNSVSADHFKCDSTEIDVVTFLKSVTTNLNDLPQTTTPEFQQSQLVRSKAKLAGILYRSNQELFGRHFFSAHKSLSILTLLSSIEAERFLPTIKGKVPQKRNVVCFLLRTIPARLDLWVVTLAGSLTNWGRSVFRAALFLIAVILFFGVIYHSGFELSWGKSLLRSIEVSLVAGYTAHTSPNDTTVIRGVTLLNLIFGIYWYSLIVPVITRKFLR